MLSLKNVKSPDSNFVNFPKVGAYGACPADKMACRAAYPDRSDTDERIEEACVPGYADILGADLLCRYRFRPGMWGNPAL